MYYVYFIRQEENSQFVAFGRTTNLGDRWATYRNHIANPKLVGLIECAHKNEMLDLELQIKHYHLKNAHYRNEWLYHTPEVIAFYQERTNVDIEAVLSDAIESHLKRDRERAQEYRKRREITEHDKKRFREYQREYHQRPEIKKRKREYYREYHRRKRHKHAKDNGQLTLFD